MNWFLPTFAGHCSWGAPFYKKATERVGRISLEKFLQDPKGSSIPLVFNWPFVIGALCGVGGWIL